MNLYEKNGNILYILNILKKFTDADHLLQIKDIKEKINEIYNVDIDPRTIRRNINLLKEKFRYDISTYAENKEGYYILKDPDTDFEPGEIRAIIDQFSYANYITASVASEIVKKCKNMQNVYENEKLKDYKIISNNTRTDNKEVIKNIEDISLAIHENKKIKFTYWKYELNNGLKNANVNTIKCSPYAIIYSLQQFYLICLKDGATTMYTYRVDRMKHVQTLDEKSSKRISKKEIENYIKTNVAMFGGNNKEIEFDCNMELLDMVIEQFGKNIDLTKIDEFSFHAKVNTSVEGFKFFALRNIENVRITKPITLKNTIKDIIANYNN